MAQNPCNNPNNNPPTIGVMCIDIVTKLQNQYGSDYHSYIAASYVKYLEASGAHVVPIWIGRDQAYYARMMDQLNGILLPGGAVFIEEADVQAHPELSSYCVASAEIIYQLALERNKAGNYFPLWGTCLGFQLILIHAAQQPKVRTECCKMREAMPLHLTEDYRQSQLFGQLPDSVAEKMSRLPFACHQHRYCITRERLEVYGLAKDWHPLATQKDASDKEFITIIEHRQLPIFGCQFHPERAAFEQLFACEDLCHLAHSQSCIELAQVLANQFISACRRNKNRFESAEAKARHLIWNWQPVFSGLLKDSNWLQCYLFEKDVDYPKKSPQ
ncbi:hypothetical protein KR018_006754 [Drosophila ironensis]|nr:hypothetical protein KR018_006754 [Drosophila ironensis]